MKSLVRFTLLILTLLAALLLLVSAYSGHISPIDSMAMAYLGLGFPIFLLLNVVMLLFWLFVSYKRAIIPLLALLLSGGAIWTYMPMNVTPQEAQGGDSLTILSYNTMAMALRQPHTESSPNPILQYLIESDADIICLQEFTFSNHSKKRLTQEDVNRALADYPYRSVAFEKYDGLACYSRYPIEKTERLSRGDETGKSAIYTIRVGERLLTVVNNHLESNRFTTEDRAQYREVIKKMEVEELGGLRKTLGPKLSEAFRRRARFADTLAEQLANVETPLVVCGDFNDTPQSYTYRKIMGSRLKDAVVESDFGPTITYHKGGFWFRIDHILYSKELRALHTERGSSQASDHYSLKTILEWQ